MSRRHRRGLGQRGPRRRRSTTCPSPGETVIGGRFAQHHGGKGGNQAVAAARLGAPTSFVGAVGADDALGWRRGRRSRPRGSTSTELRTLPDQATGVALILVDTRGENCIAVAGGANAALEPGHVRDALERLGPGAGDVVLVGHEIPTASAHEALRYATARRGDDDPQPRAGHRRRVPKRWRSPTSSRPTNGEAAQLAGHGDDRRNPRRPISLGAIAGGGHVLVSLGRRRGRCSSVSERIHHDPGGGRRSSSTRSGPGTRSTARSPRGWRPACR